MKIRIRVSRKDIDHGQPRACAKCPIARAVTRRLKPGLHAHVGSATFGIYREKGDFLFCSETLPEKASDFIDLYDDGLVSGRVAPISFELNIPAKYLKR